MQVLKQRRIKWGVGLMALALLASACEWVQMTPGETQSRTHEGVVTFTQVDEHDVNVFTDGEQTEQYSCPDGLAVPLQEGNTVTVDCVTTPLPAPVKETYVIPEQLAVVETNAPPADTLVEAQAEPMSAEVQQALGYCSGGQGWQGKTSYADRRGSRPDSLSDALNWKIAATVTWCVIGGKVQCGLSFVDTVTNGRMREIADRQGPAGNITPCGTARRDMGIDWDFMFGWCPWCTDIDVDLALYVTNTGRYGGTWSHNGDGF